MGDTQDIKNYLSGFLYGKVGRGSSVGIATRYGLDGPVIESQWRGGRVIPHPSWPALGPTQPPIQWVPGAFPEVKRPERGVNNPPRSSADVKKRVELYLYSPSEAFMVSYRVNCILPSIWENRTGNIYSLY